jgi:hypothetical protein
MKYQCSKGHIFSHAAKLIENHVRDFQYSSMTPQPTSYPDNVLEFAICPICQSKTFDEYQEPVANVESVYIYELTSGPQLGLDKLLADGYVIVNRYAKTYSLEKVKVVIPKGETIEEIIEKVKESKKVEQPDPDDNQAFTETPDQQQIKVNKAYLAKKADQP